MRTGRPPGYSPEIADKICALLASGNIGLEKLCQDPANELPPPSTVWSWLNKYPDFLEKYVRARERQTELEYDSMKEVASAPLVDDNGYPLNPQAAMAEVQRRKLEVDVMKFRLVKLQPKRFGERKDVDLNIGVKHSLTDDQFAKLLSTAAEAALPEPSDDEAEDIEFEELPSAPPMPEPIQVRVPSEPQTITGTAGFDNLDEITL